MGRIIRRQINEKTVQDGNSSTAEPTCPTYRYVDKVIEEY